MHAQGKAWAADGTGSSLGEESVGINF